MEKDEHGAAVYSELSKDITVKSLLRFSIPTILSFLLQYAFSIVDAVFASRGISVEALSAVNIVIPYITLVLGIGSMFAMGGCALVSKKKGAQLNQEARQNFTLITSATFVTGIIIAWVSWVHRGSLLRLLGADDYIFDLTLEYIQPAILTVPSVIVGVLLVQFLVAEGRPVLGMAASISSAILSTVLNVIFLFVLDMGLFGLALATGLGYTLQTFIGLTYFIFNRKGSLYFVLPKWDAKAIGRSATNGISEMITIMATSVTAIVMNNVSIRIVGFEGVAAAGMVVALQALFSSLYFGYSAGVAPIVSYNFGKERHDNLRKLYKKSLSIIAGLSVVSIVGIMTLADLLVLIYVPSGTEVHAMTVRGLRIASTGFLLMGFNIFATAWFTAFNDGLLSGTMSFFRTMVFTLIFLVTLPNILGLTGVWVALPLAEVLSVVLTIFFLIKMGTKYHYAEVAYE